MSLDLLKLRSSDELMVSYFSVEKENQFLFYFNEKTFLYCGYIPEWIQAFCHEKELNLT